MGAMGRIFEVRKHAMFARWNRMAKQFTRVAKDIAMAVHAGGPDPAANPTLRRVLQNARAVNMPKDKTDAAIRRASGKEAANYQEILYEGYAPHGVALLVETATDNPTRTVGSLRNIFSKGGGNLGTTGSVGFLFKKMGVFRLDPGAVKSQDDLELDLIDHGLHGGKGRSPARDPLQLHRLRQPAGSPRVPGHRAAVGGTRIYLRRADRVTGRAGGGGPGAHR